MSPMAMGLSQTILPDVLINGLNTQILDITLMGSPIILPVVLLVGLSLAISEKKATM